MLQILSLDAKQFRLHNNKASTLYRVGVCTTYCIHYSTGYNKILVISYR